MGYLLAAPDDNAPEERRVNADLLQTSLKHEC